jgi:transposase InsO family protein
VSQRRACRLAGQNRNTQRRPVPLADIEEQKLRRRIRELARRHVRWGRRLVYRRLRLDGWSVNHKRVQRIWREEGLQRSLLPGVNYIGGGAYLIVAVQDRLPVPGKASHPFHCNGSREAPWARHHLGAAGQRGTGAHQGQLAG